MSNSEDHSGEKARKDKQKHGVRGSKKKSTASHNAKNAKLATGGSSLSDQTASASKTQHRLVVQSRVPYEPPAPVDSPGYWLKREEFKENKSFGYFRCIPCKKNWMSAHSFPEFKQGCKNCNKEWLPNLLWVNLDTSDSKTDKPYDSSMDKPHDNLRCEACRILGSCV